MGLVTLPPSVAEYIGGLAERLANLERRPGPLYTSRSGLTTIGTAGEAALTSGPTLTIPEAGLWEVGLGILGRTTAAGLVGLQAGPSVNGAAFAAILFDFVAHEASDLAYTTNHETLTLKGGDVLTVNVKILQNVACAFEAARLSAVRVG